MELSKDIIDLYKYIYGGSSFKERIYIAAIDNEGHLMLHKKLAVREISSIINKIYPLKNANYYITPNTFNIRSKFRTTKSLFALRNIVIDIDFHGEENYEYMIDKFTDDIYDIFNTEEIPIPNIEHITGRGVHLYWCFNPVSAKLLPLYNKLKQRIIDVINTYMDDYSFTYNECNVDSNCSKNAAGLFRMFETVNSNTYEKFKTKIRILKKDKYNFQFLVDSCLINKDEWLKRKLTEKRRKIFCGDMKQLSINRINLLKEKCKGLPEGSRDLHLFHFINEDIKINPETIIEDAIFVNNTFEKPLSFHQVYSIIKTVRKATNKANVTGYIFKNTTFFDNLDIDMKTANEYNLCIRKQGKNEKRDKERKERKEKRDSSIIKLYEKGLNKSEISKKIGCSWKTVKTVLDEYLRELENAKMTMEIIDDLNSLEDAIINSPYYFYKKEVISGIKKWLYIIDKEKQIRLNKLEAEERTEMIFNEYAYMYAS